MGEGKKTKKCRAQGAPKKDRERREEIAKNS
jgi:hypothetical protein